MGKITLVLDDEVELKFKDAIYKTKGMKRGNIQKAIEEAIEMWIKEKTKWKMNKKIDVLINRHYFLKSQEYIISIVGSVLVVAKKWINYCSR